MKPLQIGLLACVSLAVAAGAGAQTAGRLTLDEAIARGLAASHRLAELAARQQGAAANADGRHAAKMPQVAALAGYTRTNHVTAYQIAFPGKDPFVIYPDVPDNYRTRLDLQWPIYTFGRFDALERAAAAEKDATGQDLAAARNDLKLEITRAFWAVVTATETVRVVDESLRRMEAYVADVGNRLKVGLVAPNDLLSAEAQKSKQEVLLVQARNNREQALTDLRRLTGAPPDDPIDVEAVLEGPAAPLAAVAPLVSEARSARPDRKALETRVSASGARLQAAEADKRPMLFVGGGFDFSSPNPRIFPRSSDWNTSWDASVNVSWTFWDGGRVKAEIGEAAAQRSAARERLAEFDTQLDAEVRQRRLDLEAALAALPSANDAVRAATEARRVLGDRFAAGVATSTDVLDAQVALLQAGLDRTMVLAAARLAEARLARAVGR
jgi:outer membrane protein